MVHNSMAGSNLLLKPNELLFKEGEKPDGMYIVRKGNLEVFLEKNGQIIKLAQVGPGGMIGEMAFFDQKPRSASVKAITDTEVTKITNNDFSKLMQQIPKWFVGIMSALSTRLRETNIRLQILENKQAEAKGYYEDVLKMLHVLNLIWYRDGEKNNKSWYLNKKIAETLLEEILTLNINTIQTFIRSLINNKILSLDEDSYKNPILIMQNRAVLESLIRFISEFIKYNPNIPNIDEECIEILECIKKLANESAYETVQITLDDVLQEGERAGLITSQWKQKLTLLNYPNDIIAFIKTSRGIGFKVDKKALPKFIEYHKLLINFKKEGLHK